MLLLNRQKAPWMGRWNGVGGKLEPEESPYECIVREGFEETGIEVEKWQDRGIMRWYRDGVDLGGVHLFSAEVTAAQVAAYKTPVCFCHEGILDWKKVDWVLHPENTGVVDNVKIMLETFFEGGPGDLYVLSYEGQTLASCIYQKSA